MEIVRYILIVILCVGVFACNYDEEPKHNFSISSDISSLEESFDLATITISVDNTLDEDLTFNIDISGNSITQDDYELDSNIVVLPAGYVSKSFAVQSNNNQSYDGNRTLQLSISPDESSKKLLDNYEAQYIELTLLEDEYEIILNTDYSSDLGLQLKRRVNDLATYPLDSTTILQNGTLILQGGLPEGDLELYLYADEEIEDLEYSLSITNNDLTSTKDSTVELDAQSGTRIYAFTKDYSGYTFQ